MRGRWTKLAELLGVNSIPIVGVLAGDWSSATALSVYWCENLIAALLVAGRMVLHARWRDRGQDPSAAPGSSFAPRTAGPFLGTAIPFTLAHGAFLALLFAMVLELTPDLADLRRAIVLLVVMQGLAFGVDLWTLADWPVAHVNERADHLLGRVVLVHLSIIAGMFLLAWLGRPDAFFAFFVSCKVLSDATSLLPRADPGTPGAPPRWLSRIMRRFPRQNGETFDDYWRRTHQGGAQEPGTTTSPAVPRPRWGGRKKR